MKRVLVIIDMQTGKGGFGPARCEVTQFEIVKQINLARKKGWEIVVVEMCWCGPTTEFIRSALVGYYYETVTKVIDSGGAEVLEVNSNGDIYRLVGVNTYACVMRTGIDLANAGKSVEIWFPACNDWKGRGVNENSLRLMLEKDNLDELPPNLKQCVTREQLVAV